MIEVNLGRWVTASLALHLKTLVETTLGLQFFVEGVDREQPEWFQKDSVVLRVTGPKTRFGAGKTRYKFEAMALLTDLVSDSANGFQNHDRLGSIGNKLCGPVPVLKYGGDKSQIGCLDIDRDASEFLRIVHFGKLDKDTEIVQGAVLVNYEISLDS